MHRKQNHHEDEKNKHCKGRKPKWGRHHHRNHCPKPPVKPCHDRRRRDCD
jgi:hypothetical protein